MTKIPNRKFYFKFLNLITEDKYPTVVLLREHFKKYSPLLTLTQLLYLDTFIRELETKEEINQSVITSCTYRTTIFTFISYENLIANQVDLNRLESSASKLKEDPLLNASQLEKLIKLALSNGTPVDKVQAPLSLIDISLKLSESNIQKLREER